MSLKGNMINYSKLKIFETEIIIKFGKKIIILNN